MKGYEVDSAQSRPTGNDHASHKTAKRRDTIPFTDADDTGVDVRGSCFEGTVRVGDGASSILKIISGQLNQIIVCTHIVEMGFDVTRHYTTERSNEIINFFSKSAYQ